MALRNCGKCGALVNETAKFCENCGKPPQPFVVVSQQRRPRGAAPTQQKAMVLRKCGKCGAVVDETDKFCKKCSSDPRPFVAVQQQAQPNSNTPASLTWWQVFPPWTKVVLGIIALLLIFAGIKSCSSDEQKSTTQTQTKTETKPTTTPAPSKVKTEDEKLSDLANSKLSSVTRCTTTGCSVAGAPPDGKTLNVISAANTGYYTIEAGPFLQQVFRDYPSVYYVQMKGRYAGDDVIAFEMCRADIQQVTHWDDWEHDPMFTSWVRNYWVDEEWRAGQARNLPPSGR